MPTTPLWHEVVRGTAPRRQITEIAIVTLFGFFPVQAEITALSATMAGGRAGEFETWLVASAVAFGTWSLAAALVWPWFRAIWKGSRHMRIFASLAAILFVYQTSVLLHDGVRLQQLGQVVPTLKPATEILLPFDSLVADSEIQVELLRNRLAEARGEEGAAIRRGIARELRRRQDILAERYKAEVQLYVDRAKLEPTP
jgi:hypothetical protein